ncbi:uncharacterized protein LOC128395987 isoform X2 [Panonychus citri]|uniref:uncharacterized protein LOC128395987 isoform X2 n=1 Tax=Panonychus citri TaxID=50023 RepID=UPI0023075382|nr:uncharacterized protein LOC128395987 isoform X2 [Panonychus citri]
MTIPAFQSENVKSFVSSTETMDYQHHPSETQSTIGLTPELSYQNYQSHQTVKMIKMVAYTMIGMTIILGSFILLSAYVQSGGRCNCYRGYQLGSESRDSPYYEPLTAASGDDSGDGASRRLPIRILMDGEAGQLMKDGKKGRINCEVERRVATQIIASEPKMLITPYGNMTTDPKLIHMTGEKMFFSCSSGNPSKSKKPKQTIKTILKLDKPIEVMEIKKPDVNVTSPATPIVSRPKREAEKPAKPSKEHKECSCDCSC